MLRIGAAVGSIGKAAAAAVTQRDAGAKIGVLCAQHSAATQVGLTASMPCERQLETVRCSAGAMQYIAQLQLWCCVVLQLLSCHSKCSGTCSESIAACLQKPAAHTWPV